MKEVTSSSETAVPVIKVPITGFSFIPAVPVVFLPSQLFSTLIKLKWFY